METTVIKQEVSDNVREAAEHFATGIANQFEGKRHLIRTIAFIAFKAGAAYMKPIEHENNNSQIKP